MADSKEPEKSRALTGLSYLVSDQSWDDAHPVRNRLPILALEKSKREVGLSFLTISRLTQLRKLRMSSRFGEDI